MIGQNPNQLTRIKIRLCDVLRNEGDTAPLRAAVAIVFASSQRNRQRALGSMTRSPWTNRKP
jgi:hypothetical protein